MKVRNIIFGMAVTAVASIGAYKAHNANSAQFSDLQMENIEMLAEALEGIYGPCDGDTQTCRFYGVPGVFVMPV